MSMDNLSKNFNRHLEENFWLYIVSVLCICIGVVMGAYTVKYLGDFNKNDLVNYLNNFSEGLLLKQISPRLILWEAVKNNITLIIILWILGLTIIGIPIILILNILKGFTFGFATSFIITNMGAKGIWFTLIAILPQNIIYIPCLVFGSVLAMKYSITMLKDKTSKGFNNYGLRVSAYSILFFIIAATMSIGLVIETYVSPFFS